MEETRSIHQCKAKRINERHLNAKKVKASYKTTRHEQHGGQSMEKEVHNIKSGRRCKIGVTYFDGVPVRFRRRIRKFLRRQSIFTVPSKQMNRL